MKTNKRNLVTKKQTHPHNLHDISAEFLGFPYRREIIKRERRQLEEMYCTSGKYRGGQRGKNINSSNKYCHYDLHSSHRPAPHPTPSTTAHTMPFHPPPPLLHSPFHPTILLLHSPRPHETRQGVVEAKGR